MPTKYSKSRNRLQCFQSSITHRPATNGFTFGEVMISVALTAVMALGTMSYQYHSVKASGVAQAQIMATRVGQLLLEDWKSVNGDPDYDPESLQLGFTTTRAGEFGDYRITLGNKTFYMRLQFNDVDQDDLADITLREINVTVRWRIDYGQGSVSATDPAISLTTYVRRDQ
jgi:Tfp pilus assembly protein PilV